MISAPLTTGCTGNLVPNRLSSLPIVSKTSELRTQKEVHTHLILCLNDRTISSHVKCLHHYLIRQHHGSADMVSATFHQGESSLTIFQSPTSVVICKLRNTLVSRIGQPRLFKRRVHQPSEQCNMFVLWTRFSIVFSLAASREGGAQPCHRASFNRRVKGYGTCA